jgi:murein DD-endopeptidase MepM/ murein hydrolase activator NlpD
VRVLPLLGFAVVTLLATGAASVAGGLPVGLGDPPTSGRVASPAAALPGGEEASSQAITSESGPVHPVSVDGPVDYGDSGARFGAPRYGHAHEGQDIFARPGTPLVAVREGIVIKRGNDAGRGNYVAIYSAAADHTYVYLHMLRPTPLEPGREVAAGEQVGSMGCTGSCFGTHLHLEVRLGKGINRKPIDPLPLLEQWPQMPAAGRSG